MGNCSSTKSGNKDEKIFSIDKYINNKIATETPSEKKITIEKNKYCHLVVDDSETNRYVLRLLLERLCINAKEAANGYDVIQLINNNNTYDIIWMDINMPIINGIECTKQLRANKYHGVIIALTGNIEHRTIKKCYEAGINDFLSKPIVKEELIAKIHKYSEKK